MESKGSSIEDASQLQDAPLQDSAVRTRTHSLTEQTSYWPRGKVVIHKAGKLIYGTVLRDQPVTSWQGFEPMLLDIVRNDNGEEQSISLADAKAVFFVKSFTGKAKHQDLHFYDEEAAAPLLWVRIIFFDEEIMECLIENSAAVMLAPAFFARPVDPEGNNIRLFLVKKNIRHFQVLAVRHPTMAQTMALDASPVQMACTS